jgi:hypothetical protein
VSDKHHIVRVDEARLTIGIRVPLDFESRGGHILDHACGATVLSAAEPDVSDATPNQGRSQSGRSVNGATPFQEGIARGGKFLGGGHAAAAEPKSNAGPNAKRWKMLVGADEPEAL